MTDRAADKPSDATAKGEAAAKELGEMFPDENEHTRGARHSGKQTESPAVETYQEVSPYADMDQLGKLLDEGQSEEEMLGMPPYRGERSQPVTEQSQPDLSTYDPNIDATMEMNSMEDMVDIDSMETAPSPERESPKAESEYLDIFDTSNEKPSHGTDAQGRTERLNEDSANPGKRIRLTEDDYADRFFPGREEEPSRDKEVEESGSEIEEEPSASPSVEEPVAASSLDAIKSRARIGILLGLLGVVGAGAAIWLNFGTSNRVDQLEARRVASSPAAAVHAETAAIASLNRRVDKLSGRFAAHMKQFAQMQDKVALQKAAESKPAAPAAAQPKPVASAAMHPKPVSAKPAAPAAKKPKPVTTTPAVAAVKHATSGSAKPSSSARPVAAAHPSRKGEWVVNLSSFRKPAMAARELARVKKLGVQADSIKVEVHGQTWFRIRALGFASEKAARAHLKAVEKRVGISDAWIGAR